jgi:quercetin dioxygenase-like cupin family protein
MSIHVLLKELEGRDKPLAKAIQSGPGFKVLAIGFKEGMILAKHKTATNARLYVIQGNVRYESDSESVILNELDQHQIPVDEMHAVTAITDALIFVIKETH